jgi:hypothetical protein
VSAYQLQIGIYAALDADTALSALIVGIYDNPSQAGNPEDDTAFPYVTISDGSSTPWDTDTKTGQESIAQVHVWSRASNALQVKQIQGAIYDVLHRGTLTITGSVFIGSDSITQTVERDPDGITRHGVQEFRIIYEEA